MTKFQLMSDIHQEWAKNPLIRKDDIKGDVLLLAGDITNHPKKIGYLKDLEVPIFYVPGNHEYYGHVFDNMKLVYQDYFENNGMHNIKFMDRETVIHNGVRIIAATLWTNFQAPIAGLIGSDEEIRWENQEKYCGELMNDFNKTVVRAFTTTRAIEEHNKALGYIKEVLSSTHEGPTIVMTHHAPSFRSSHRKYDSSAIKAGFCSALDYLIEEYQPEYWVHGHCHDTFNYFIGKTNVLCNPRGYGVENWQGFQYDLTIEL